MKLLKNKSAIVTGAASGIGQAIAILYAKEGAFVLVSDIDETGGKKTVALITDAGGEAAFFKADVSSHEQCKAMVEEAVRFFGGLHIAVNNAGIGGALTPTGKYPIDEWDKVIAVNLSSVFYGMRFQIPAMLESGGGSIVNVTSILGSVGTKNAPAYVTSKHGIVGLTKTAALDYADQNIRVNALGPAYIRTPLLTNALDEATLKVIESLHPVGRLGTSEEVAALSLWLNSDHASFVTGSYYAVDGGYLAQ